MTDLKKYARDKPCMVRLPGCDGGGQTTVLAHYRSSSTGMGQKEPDVMAAHCCDSCHRAEHNGIPGWTKAEIKTAFLEWILRTQKQLVKDGIIKW